MSGEESKQAKLTFLEQIMSGEERFFHDYSAEIEAYLVDADEDVRAAAVQCLWEYPDPDYVDVLIDMAENDPSKLVRQRAISGLGIYVYEAEMAAYDDDWSDPIVDMYEDVAADADVYARVMDYLVGLYTDASRPLNERRYALEALGFYNDPDISTMIEDAYQSGETDMQVSALFAMGRSGNTRWEKHVLAALDSPVPAIEFEAVRAAGALHLESANNRLMSLAKNASNLDLRIEAIWALGQIGHQAAFTLLEELQRDRNEDVREVAEAALDEWLMFSAVENEFLDDDEFNDDTFGTWLNNGDDIARD